MMILSDHDIAKTLRTRTTGLNATRQSILPGVLMTSLVAGLSYAIRQLPGMATFSR